VTTQHPKRRANPRATCPRHPKKEYRRLVRAAWEAGWWCERNRKNYIFCYRPSDDARVHVPSTPRKQGTLNRVTDRFRKLGLDV
jgi:hypothetical protein